MSKAVASNRAGGEPLILSFALRKSWHALRHEMAAGGDRRVRLRLVSRDCDVTAHHLKGAAPDGEVVFVSEDGRVSEPAGARGRYT